MQYPLIKDNRVVNVIEADEGYKAPDGFTLGPPGGEICQTWNGTAYGSPADVPATQAELLDYLADLRWAAENAGVDFSGIPLPTDRERRSALKDAADKLRDGTLTSPIAVAFSASVYANVTLEQIDACVAAITVYVQKVFSDAATVAAQIIAGTLTTKNQVTAAWAAARTS